MPVSPTYPGVYIDEVASGVRPIAGVATSIAAFVGRARRGPVNKAILVNSYSDFVRTFGDLWALSPMSYAVQQFFQSGGQSAYVVRVQRGGAKATARLDLGQSLRLRAKANFETYGVTVTHDAAAPQWTLHYHDASGAEVGVALVVSGMTAAQLAPIDSSTYVEWAGVDTEQPAERPDAFSEVKYFRPTGGGTSELLLPATFSGHPEAQRPLIESVGHGTYGNSLQATASTDTTDPVDKQAFNLTISEVDAEGNTVQQEIHRNLYFATDNPRNWSRVLEEESSLARVLEEPENLPTASLARLHTTSAVSFTGGTDGNAVSDTDVVPDPQNKDGIYALDDADLFNLLCLPPRDFDNDVGTSAIARAIAYCESRRAFAIIDGPKDWSSSSDIMGGDGVDSLSIRSKNAAIYFPRLKVSDPLQEGRLREVAPSGAIAGLIAKTDATQGVWSAPAGIDARVNIARDLKVNLTDVEHGFVNPLGVNVIRRMPGAGHVIWGARTLDGDDRLASEWKYLP